MNIVLIGFRGTGKSTVGKILSKKIGWKFISSDDEIEKRYGRISRIVDEKGWEYFRRLEEQIIEEIAKEDKAIIATGGGVVINDKNVKNLKRNGKFILLTASKEEIIKRIKNSDRPLLTNSISIEEDVDKVLDKRMPIYLSIADYIINTTFLNPNEVAEKIIKMVKNLNI